AGSVLSGGFLAGGCLSGGALPLGRTAKDSIGVPMEGLRFSLKIGMVQPGETLADKFRLLQEIGYDGVELDSPNEYANEDVLAALKSAPGFKIPGVVDSKHWQWTLGDADADVRRQGREALETALRDAKAYGASSVLLVPGVVDAARSYADVYRRSQEEIRKVVPLAEKLGVDIAFENVWNQFLLSPLEAARYVDEFESERVGWYFDIGNLVNTGYPDQWIRTLGPRIKKLDVKDYSRKKRDEEGLWKGFACKIGDGDADWPRVRGALTEIGYSGWASAEVAGGDEERLAEILERMRSNLL
ncbi:MAG: sugar phosphate isomerase/epimerase family protein, partial [Planctomycetota bacterium]